MRRRVHPEHPERVEGRRIPGRSLFAQKAHFLKAGPHEPTKRARHKRRRKLNRGDEREAARGDGEV